MYENSITLENIERLKKHGVHFLGPDYGDLACGDVGLGRMVEPELIIAKINACLKLSPSFCFSFIFSTTFFSFFTAFFSFSTTTTSN